jgi:D-xylose 1-dehydrogenase (NADP+, D-xylono-1,5-lactone-forming)
MLRWGFIGAGNVAKLALAPAVHSSATAHLQGVASRNPTLASALNPTTTYSDYNALLADSAIDAIYISLPNHLHATWTIKALNAGKHVLCEKPFATSLSDATAMAEAATENQRTLMEAIWFNFHPRTRRLIQLIESGELGEISQIDSIFTFTINAPDNYRLNGDMGGGALLDLGPYLLHLWASLTGPTSKINYTQINQNFSGSAVDMTTIFTAEIDKTVLANATASFIQAPKQEITINTQSALIEFSEGEAFTNHNAPSALTIAGHKESFAPVDPYQLMIEEFAAITQGKTNTIAPLATTLQVTAQLEEIAATSIRS